MNYLNLIPQNLGYQISYAFCNYIFSTNSSNNTFNLGLQTCFRLRYLSQQFEILRSINTWRIKSIIVLTPLVLVGIKKSSIKNFSVVKQADTLVTAIYSYSDTVFNTACCVYYIALLYFGEPVGGIIGIATLTLLALRGSPRTPEKLKQIVLKCDSLINHPLIVPSVFIASSASGLYRVSAPPKEYILPIISILLPRFVKH